MKFILIFLFLMGCGSDDEERTISEEDSKFLTVASLDSINTINVTSYTISGTCSDDQGMISLEVDGTSMNSDSTCNGGIWNATYDFSTILDGSLDFRFTHNDINGKVVAQESVVVQKDTIIPVVGFGSLASIDSMNDSNFEILGTCSDDNQAVEISITSITISTQPTCISGVWNLFLDLSALPDGSVQILADHENSDGESAIQASVSIIKDASLPLVAITVAEDIDADSEFSYTISGTCSEESQEVVVDIGGEAPAPNPPCLSGTWEATINPSAISDGSVNITADHSNSTGANANQATVTINKDVAPPSVSIDIAPNINSGNQSNYTFSGSCSVNGAEVTVVIGDTNPSTQPICSSGAWSVTMNVSAIADGPVDISADHDFATQAAITINKNTTLLL